MIQLHTTKCQHVASKAAAFVPAVPRNASPLYAVPPKPSTPRPPRPAYGATLGKFIPCARMPPAAFSGLFAAGRGPANRSPLSDTSASPSPPSLPYYCSPLPPLSRSGACYPATAAVFRPASLRVGAPSANLWIGAPAYCYYYYCYYYYYYCLAAGGEHTLAGAGTASFLSFRCIACIGKRSSPSADDYYY